MKPTEKYTISQKMFDLNENVLTVGLSSVLVNWQYNVLGLCKCWVREKNAVIRKKKLKTETESCIK